MYRIRFIFIMMRCLVQKPIALTDEFRLQFRAIPGIDTDVGRLFTHAYGHFMGLARWHLVFHSDFRAVALKNRWAPVTTRETMHYKKSIKAFQKITLSTRIVHWNDQRFFVEHKFLVGGEVKALAFVEGLLRGPSGIVKPNEAFSLSGKTLQSPPAPSELQSWFAPTFG